MYFANTRFWIIGVMVLPVLVLSGCGRPNDGTPPAGSPPAASASTPVVAEASASKPVPFTQEAYADTFTTCNLEVLDDSRFAGTALEANANKVHRLSGWMLSPDNAHASFTLRFEDKAQGLRFELPAAQTIARPDVAAAAGVAGAPADSGFAVALDAHAIPGGHYHVYLAVLEGNSVSYCDNGREIDYR